MGGINGARRAQGRAEGRQGGQEGRQGGQEGRQGGQEGRQGGQEGRSALLFWPSWNTVNHGQIQEKGVKYTVTIKTQKVCKPWTNLLGKGHQVHCHNQEPKGV